MGMMALGVLVATADPAGAVSDRNLYERGQMPPGADTSAAMGHVNAMMQERFAQAGGPANRTATAFAEEIVKTLPLIPGATVITYPVVTPAGNLLAGTGRGIGFSHITVHEPVTGRIIWKTPRYIGPTDYATQRTVGPGAYLGGYPIVINDPSSAAYNWAAISDGYNVWSFEADTGAVNWIASQGDWPPGPQRIREEPLRQRSMANDIPIGVQPLPGSRAPSGEPLVGSLYTRGNFAYVDASSGELIILQNGDVGNVARGYQAPILYLIIDLLCFPGGQLALEFKDWCSAFVYTRYFSANTVMADPLRNRVTVTYAGDGQTYDRFMTWEFNTDADGRVELDPDLADGESPAMSLAWSTDFGLNSGATPTWSDSGAVIFGVDGAGITNAFNANTGAVIVSSTGGGAGFSPSTDHNDQLVICSPEAGLAYVSSKDGRFIWQNDGGDLGVQHLPVTPDSPLLVTGRPKAECVGFPATHPDVFNAQFVMGYPVTLFEALAALGIPLPSTVTSAAVVDFAANARTGETVEALRRSIYTGSGEASTGMLDSGRALSGRVDAVASIAAGILNLLLPRRFDIPPAEGGFVISEPDSFRESIQNQFEGAEIYCNEIVNGLAIPGDAGGESIPALASADFDTPRGENEERLLQLSVNKMGYINSIMKNSIPPRMDSASSRLPSELNALGRAGVDAFRNAIIANTTTARDLMLGGDATYPAGCGSDEPYCTFGRSHDPTDAERAQASAAMENACRLARNAQLFLALPVIPEPAPEPEIPEGDPHCYVEYGEDPADEADGGVFQIAGTTASAGDATNPNLQGKMVVKYVDDGAGNIQPGRVEMMWVWIYQKFDFISSPTVRTNVHNFSPTCNGEITPDWSDVANIPTACAYESAPGVPMTVADVDAQNPIAIGELVGEDLTAAAINWQNCNVVDSSLYWNDDNSDYTEALAASNEGRGCIALKAGRTGDTGANETVLEGAWHSFGTVNCEGAASLCKAGKLNPGDNIQAFTWPQPLQYGPVGGPDSSNSTEFLADTLNWPGTNPVATDSDFSIEPGFQSVEIPNSAPSHTWMGATLKRVEGGLTTCNPVAAP